MMQFVHNKTGNTYLYVGVGKMKMQEDAWVDCIFYSRNGHTYAREIEDFFYKFTVCPQENILITKATDMYSNAEWI